MLKNQNYDYIGIFIGFLERIVRIVQRLLHKKDVITGKDIDTDADDSGSGSGSGPSIEIN